MRLCINEATTMPYSLEEDILAAAKAKFQAMELWWDKVKEYLCTHSTKELKKLLVSNNIRPIAMCPLRIWPFRDSEPARKEFIKAIKVASKIDCKLIIVCPDFQPARLSKNEAMDTCGIELRKMAEEAKQYSLNLVIEPIGGHTIVPGPKQAIDLIKRSGSPDNVGLLMDTFHYFRSQVPENEIKNIPKNLLKIVHINDCEDGAINELTDANRLYPTLGVIPLERYIKLLDEIGYNGYLSVEIFRPEYWKKPVQEIMDNSYKYLSKLLY